MAFGQIIKELRRSADMTQEQLAELLSISPQAVSRWENDIAMPDISLLPLLANTFNVSADYLLGIDIEKNNEKIDEFLAAAHKARIEEGGLEKRTAILREANRQFPRSHKIMEKLADALVCEYSRKGIKDYDEVFRLCNRILAECTDSTIRNRALQTLGTAYAYAGKDEQMRQVAEQMQPLEYSREVFMLYRWGMQGEKSLAQRQELLSSIICYLTETLGLLVGHRYDDGSFVYPPEDRISLWQLIVSLVELLFPDGDYQFMAQQAEQACRFLTSAYLHKGDTENAIYWLQKGCDFAIHFDTYDFDAKHTSPALRGYSDSGWIMENGCTHSASFLDDLLGKEETAVIKNDPRIIEMITRAQKTAIKS